MLHQAGGVTHTRDVVALRFNREIVEVDTTKHNAGIGGRWYQADMSVHAGMKAHAFGGSRIRNCRLEHLQGKILAHCNATDFDFVP